MAKDLPGKGALRKLGRFRDWWSYKVSYLFAPFYFLLIHFDGGILDALRIMAGMLGYFVATAAFGHVVNDFGDLESDAKAGKPNSCQGRSKGSILSVLIGLAIASVLFLLLAGAKALAFGLAGVELLLFLSYSLRPLRLKESHLGLLVDSGYAHLLPFGITAIVMAGQLDEPVPAGFLLFSLALVWQAGAGLRGITGHELIDLPNDLAAGNRTAVVRMGRERASRWLRHWIVPVEVGALLMLLGTLTLFLWLPMAGLVIYAAWFAWKFRPFAGTSEGTSPIQSVDRWDHFLDLFYRKVFPLLVLAGVLFVAPEYWPLLPMHLLLFHWPAKRSIPKAVIRQEIRKGESGMQIQVEGCYLTSRLTSRTDINIRLTASLDGREVAGKWIDLCYEPNRFSNFYRDRFDIEETPVSFRMRVTLPPKEAKQARLAFSVEARWSPPDECVELHRETVKHGINA